MESAKKPYDHAFQFKDNPTITETFADGVHLITVDGSNAKITFTASRSDPPKPGNKAPTGAKVVTARLVLSAPALTALFNQLQQLMAGMEQMGVIQREGGLPLTRQ